jgi:hypothetical protein
MMRLRGRFHAGRPQPRAGDRGVEKASTIDAGGGDAAPGDESADDESYRLISVDAVSTPEGCLGSDWHIYRIAQRENVITGYRRGDLTRVKADAETIVTALNGRRQWAQSKATSKGAP